MSLRISNLPKLAECPCYESNPDAGPEAARGTLLDGVFRRRVHDQSHAETISAEDLVAVDWAINTLRTIAADAEIETRESHCRVEAVGVPGTADAVVPELLMSADLKTGAKRNYREQMAGYALGFMERYFADEWTANLLFCDQRELVTHRFTYDEAKQIVSEIAAGFHDGNKQPNPCRYCGWCAKQVSCPARRQIAAAVTTEVASPEFRFEAVLADPEKLGKFLTACSVVEDYREKAEAKAKEILLAQGKVPGWRIQSRKGSEYVTPDIVGHHIGRMGFGPVLAAYGSMSGKKFRDLWALKMGSDPFPEDAIQTGKGSVALVQARATKAKE